MAMCAAAITGNAVGSPVCAAGGWLALAASPSFALMAWLTGHDPVPMTLCASGAGLPPMSGMTAMYVLMSIFHLSPWLQRACALVAPRA